MSPPGRSVCSTERIINIQTLKVRPNIVHQSFDLAKDRTKSILKQASHFITENGEVADYQVAHLEEIYNSDGDLRHRTIPARHASRPVSSMFKGPKPMTAFMDYKDYRIQYEGNGGDSSFDSSKDYSGISNSNSVYNRAKINKEIRVRDREKARRGGARSQLVNSDEAAKEEHKVNPERTGHSSPRPSGLKLQMKKGKKSNVKIKSFIAAARDTFNNASRELSRLNEASMDYYGVPKISGRQQVNTFDKGPKRGKKRQAGVYHSQQMLADDSSRRRSAGPSSRLGKGAAGILQQPKSQIKTQRLSARRSQDRLDALDENEARRSVTFDLSQPQSPKSLGRGLAVRPQLRRLKS